MKQIFTSIVALLIAITAIAQHTGSELYGLNRLGSITLDILEKQRGTVSNKGTTNLVRLIGSATRGLGQLSDSVSLIYSNGRGSRLNTNPYAYSEYYLYSNVEGGYLDMQRINRGKPYLMFDTAYLYSYYAGSVEDSQRIFRQYSGNNINQRKEEFNSFGTFTSTYQRDDLTFNSTDQQIHCKSYRDTALQATGNYTLTAESDYRYVNNNISVDTTSYYVNPFGSAAAHYSYNATGNITMITYQYYSAIGVSTILDQTTYTYNAGNLLQTTVTQEFDGSTLVNHQLDSFFYTGLNMTGWHDYYWSEVSNAWKPSTFHTIHYDSNNDRDTMWGSFVSAGVVSPPTMLFTWSYTSLKYYANTSFWMSINGVWDTVARESTNYYYEPYATSVNQTHAATADFATIYPIPATNFLYVSVKVSIANDMKMIVYNSNGQLVMEMNSSASNSKLPVSELPAGTYFLEVICGEKSQRMSFIKS